MAVDTLAYTKHLEGAGIERKIAEAHVEAINRHILPDLTTKQDLRDAVTELRLDLNRLQLRVLGAMGGIAGLALTIAILIF
jgi:hypothetical protein